MPSPTPVSDELERRYRKRLGRSHRRQVWEDTITPILGVIVGIVLVLILMVAFAAAMNF